MSRGALAFAFCITLVVCSSFLVALNLGRGDSSPLTEDLSHRLSRLEEKLALLAEREIAAPALSPSMEFSPSSRVLEIEGEAVIPSDEVPTGPMEGIDRVLGKLDEIDRRVQALEQDPIARGYAFIDSDNADLRKRGILSLANLMKSDPEALNTVRNLVNDPSASVRSVAIDALADAGDKESVGIYLAAFEDPDANVRREAIDAILDLGLKEHAVDVAQLANDPNVAVRRDVVNILGELKYEGGQDFLLGALSDKDDEVRGQAIASLGEIGAKDSAPILRKMFNENPGRHKWRLAFSLKNLGDPEPYQREVNRLSTTALEGESERGRRDALRTLSYYARNESKEIFQKALEDPSQSVRETAQRALGSGRRRR